MCKKRTALLAGILMAAAAGCSPADGPQVPPKTVPLPELFEAVPGLSQEQPTLPEALAETPDAKTSDESPVSDDARRQPIFDAVKKVVDRYQSGQITPDERFQPLPSDFCFPDELEMAELTIVRREVMGDYRVTFASADSRYEMRLMLNNFAYVMGDGSVIGGDWVVTDAEFLPQEGEEPR